MLVNKEIRMKKEVKKIAP